jgi:hypothetical protein
MANILECDMLSISLFKPSVFVNVFSSFNLAICHKFSPFPLFGTSLLSVTLSLRKDLVLLSVAHAASKFASLRPETSQQADLRRQGKWRL